MKYNIQDIVKGNIPIAIIGLGYVGINLAVEFAKKTKVIGYDVDEKRIELYKNGIDLTGETEKTVIENTTISFTSNALDLRKAGIIIIAVPTPINTDRTPDLSPLIAASRTVGENLSRNTIVVYESTVFPGATEDICIPVIEQSSSLKCGIDFKVGYSPERINPGDKIHRINKISKIVASIDNDTAEFIKQIYEIIIEEEVHTVSNIKTAEAIKVVENTQRDVNIAFMNEISMIMNQFGINTFEVIEGMNTKWNALHFYPGLVGGHCIGVDPYYLSYAANKLGMTSQMILLSRTINENMSSYIINLTVREFEKAGISIKNSRIAILGITFKENCPDTRNSKVLDIVKILKEKEANLIIVDSWADNNVVFEKTGIRLSRLEDVKNVSCIILAVAHDEFRKIKIDELKGMFGMKKILIDVKSAFNSSIMKKHGFYYNGL